nr:MAG TPA: hypothetical protein [Caudoviricetes sp.]
MKEKVAILEAMEQGMDIQYSTTDGETDEWEDLKTTELDFSLYTYRVKSDDKPKSNPDAKFKAGDKLVNIADEGTFDPSIVTVSDFSSTGEYQWKEVYNRTPINVIDTNYVSIDDVYWWHYIYYHKEDRYTLAPTMMKLGEAKDRSNETYHPMFSMGFRIPRGKQNDE